MYLVVDCRKQKVSLQTVTAKMTMIGIDMNKNGFQTCCKSLRLATAVPTFLEHNYS